jgi:hypothetical protein
MVEEPASDEAEKGTSDEELLLVPFGLHRSKHLSDSFPKLKPERAVNQNKRENKKSPKSKSRSRRQDESPEWRWAYMVSCTDPQYAVRKNK